jgi:hypothetical protein
MRKPEAICCTLLILLAAVCVPRAQDKPEPPKPAPLTGTWTGTWEGAGSGGGFELTLEQPKEGALTGKVAVTGEPAYSAVFKSLSFDGKKLTASYDFPPDEAAEISLAATADGGKLTGTWAVVVKADKTEVASGSWTVTKKAKE